MDRKTIRGAANRQLLAKVQPVNVQTEIEDPTLKINGRCFVSGSGKTQEVHMVFNPADVSVDDLLINERGREGQEKAYTKFLVIAQLDERVTIEVPDPETGENQLWSLRAEVQQSTTYQWVFAGLKKATTANLPVVDKTAKAA